MKHLQLIFGLTTAFIFLCPIISKSQGKVFTSFEIFTENIDTDALDEIYEPGTVVFVDSLDTYRIAYREFVGRLGNHLLDHGFKKGDQFRIFSRLYLDESGNIEFWLINPIAGEVDLEKLKKALGEFSKEETFNKTANKKFSQCGPLSIQL